MVVLLPLECKQDPIGIRPGSGIELQWEMKRAVIARKLSGTKNDPLRQQCLVDPSLDRTHRCSKSYARGWRAARESLSPQE